MRFSLLLSFVFLNSTLLSFADAPSRLHYNGYLSNAVGEAVDCADPVQCGDNYDFTFRLYGDATSNVVLWEETHSAVSVYSGSFSVVLGSVNPITVEHVDGPTWLAVKVNGNPEMEPRQEVVSAAYALRSQTADSAVVSDNAVQLGGVDAGDYALAQNLNDLQNSLAPIATAGLPDDLADGDDDNDTLGAMTCGAGMVPKATATGWVCGLDEQGGGDTTLSEEDVDLMVANNGYARDAELGTLQGTVTALQTDLLNAQDGLSSAQSDLTTLQGIVEGQGGDLTALQGALTTAQDALASLESNLSSLQGSLAPVALSGSFTDLGDVPVGLSDGDDNTQLTEAEVDAFVANNDYSTGAHTVDTNTDVLAGLACATGQHARWDGASWTCVRGAAAVETIQPGACDTSNLGAMYYDVATGILNICDGVAYKTLKVCSGLCPSFASAPCGEDVIDDCGAVCGTGIGLNVATCDAPSTVACGGALSDTCGNPCGGAGTGFNSGQCSTSATTCGATVVDSCANACGSTGTLCSGADVCVSGACTSVIEHFDGSSFFYNSHPVNTHNADRAIDACNSFLSVTTCAVGTGSCGGATYVYNASGPNCTCSGQYIFYYGTEGSGFLGGSADYAGKHGPACGIPSHTWY